jgi:sugar O-acyltransferase (sialic acid O-acetyltransferase NeuD family)
LKKYIIFGTGSFISDVFDLIHVNGGVVHKIYQNVKETMRPGDLSLRQRAAILGYPLQVYDSLNDFVPEEDCAYVLGCTTVQKYGLVDELKSKWGLTLARLVHPEAYLGANVHVGEGVVVNARAIIAPNAFLDDFCLVNRAAVIGHDTRIGRYTRIAPAAVIGGLGRIGEKCSVGIGAIVLDRIEIGDLSVIGAGALVTRKVPGKVVAYGAPAKVVRSNDESDFETYIKRLAGEGEEPVHAQQGRPGRDDA